MQVQYIHVHGAYLPIVLVWACAYSNLSLFLLSHSLLCFPSFHLFTSPPPPLPPHPHPSPFFPSSLTHPIPYSPISPPPSCLQITLEAMKSEHDQISLQGIEFWSTVCDEEADLSIEAVEVYTRTHVPTVRTVYVHNVLKMGTCTCTCTLCTYIHTCIVWRKSIIALCKCCMCKYMHNPLYLKALPLSMYASTLCI